MKSGHYSRHSINFLMQEQQPPGKPLNYLEAEWTATTNVPIISNNLEGERRLGKRQKKGKDTHCAVRGQVIKFQQGKGCPERAFLTRKSLRGKWESVHRKSQQELYREFIALLPSMENISHRGLNNDPTDSAQWRLGSFTVLVPICLGNHDTSRRLITISELGLVPVEILPESIYSLEQSGDSFFPQVQSNVCQQVGNQLSPKYTRLGHPQKALPIFGHFHSAYASEQGSERHKLDTVPLVSQEDFI